MTKKELLQYIKDLKEVAAVHRKWAAEFEIAGCIDGWEHESGQAKGLEFAAALLNELLNKENN